jgi:hypothetical protein
MTSRDTKALKHRSRDFTSSPATTIIPRKARRVMATTARANAFYFDNIVVQVSKLGSPYKNHMSHKDKG